VADMSIGREILVGENHSPFGGNHISFLSTPE
jgi:hypothetical protein